MRYEGYVKNLRFSPSKASLINLTRVKNPSSQVNETWPMGYFTLKGERTTLTEPGWRAFGEGFLIFMQNQKRTGGGVLEKYFKN